MGTLGLSIDFDLVILVEMVAGTISQLKVQKLLEHLQESVVMNISLVKLASNLSYQYLSRLFGDCSSLLELHQSLKCL